MSTVTPGESGDFGLSGILGSSVCFCLRTLTFGFFASIFSGSTSSYGSNVSICNLGFEVPCLSTTLPNLVGPEAETGRAADSKAGPTAPAFIFVSCGEIACTAGSSSCLRGCWAIKGCFFEEFSLSPDLTFACEGVCSSSTPAPPSPLPAAVPSASPIRCFKSSCNCTPNLVSSSPVAAGGFRGSSRVLSVSCSPLASSCSPPPFPSVSCSLPSPSCLPPLSPSKSSLASSSRSFNPSFPSGAEVPAGGFGLVSAPSSSFPTPLSPSPGLTTASWLSSICKGFSSSPSIRAPRACFPVSGLDVMKFDLSWADRKDPGLCIGDNCIGVVAIASPLVSKYIAETPDILDPPEPGLVEWAPLSLL
mmetsp:Transcript_7365/g.10299  ORF Transcript_7365/g.10299 Transcript_7365/m.10299 type:complete len:362 (+) Transcript_7365:238-1323(+)